MSTRERRVVEMLSSEQYFTTGQMLKVLRYYQIDRIYLMWTIRKLRESGSLDEIPDPSHKLRKLYRLRILA